MSKAKTKRNSSYLIILVLNQDKVEAEKIVVRYPPKDPKLSRVKELLDSHGYTLQGFGGARFPEELEVTAYCSPNKEGIGRAGSQVWSFGATRKVPK